MMNLFARAIGGIAGDWAGSKWGLAGRTRLLGVTIFLEGLLIVLFSRMTVLGPATAVLLLLGLFVCMACGVTFAVVPLIRPRAVGSVSGIVGAGGNLGAVLAAILFKCESLSGADAFLILGGIVVATSFCALTLRFRESKGSASEVEPVPALMSAD